LCVLQIRGQHSEAVAAYAELRAYLWLKLLCSC